MADGVTEREIATLTVSQREADRHTEKRSDRLCQRRADRDTQKKSDCVRERLTETHREKQSVRQTVLERA